MADSKFINILKCIEELLSFFCVDVPVPTIQELTRELAEVDNWFMLGICLFIPVHKLRETAGTVQQRKVDMLDHWLITTRSASWKNVISALEQLDYIALASRLKAKYILTGEGQASPIADGE